MQTDTAGGPTAVLDLRRYVHEALGVRVHPARWPGERGVPALLRGLYTFSEVRLLGARCLLVVDANDAERSPAAVRKHLGLLGPKWAGPVIYVRTRMTAYNRKRLIEQRIPFIVPGNQMYLPMLGVDLREHFRQLRGPQRRFSPATQALLLHMLLCETEVVFTPGALAERLGYSAMTMTRAFNELEAGRIGEVSAAGSERRLRLPEDRRSVWEAAEPLLISPVRKRLFVQRVRSGPPLMVAGLTALAEYSRLAPPEHTVYAVGREDWRLLQTRWRPVRLPVAEPGAVEVEVWSYRPGLLAAGSRVDRLSLYLSLKGGQDERVEQALEELMGEVPW